MEVTLIIWYANHRHIEPTVYIKRCDSFREPFILEMQDPAGGTAQIHLLPSESPHPVKLRDEELERTHKGLFSQFGIPEVWDGFAVLTLIVDRGYLITAIHNNPIPVEDVYADYKAQKQDRIEFFLTPMYS